jgi:hypothetical protein
METAAAAELYERIALASVSIPASALVLVVVLPAAAIAGYLVGKITLRRATAAGRGVDHSAGEVALGGIMALLGLILAFTFGNALSTFQDRNDALLEEANAIGTAFLRADLLPDAEALALRSALLDYARTRVPPAGGAGNREELIAFLGRTLEAQAALWPAMLEATADPVPPPLRTFVAASINDVIDAHSVRLQTFSVSLLGVTRTVALSVALVALFMLGNQSGSHGRELTWRTFLFSATLLLVMMVIQDIQRSEQGFVTTDPTPLLVTLADMEAALADG